MNAITSIRPATHQMKRGGSIVSFLRSRLHAANSLQENLHAVFFDDARRVLGEKALGGTRSGSVRTRSREILSDALALKASGMIIAHNHPSGDCQPSEADLEATRKLSEIARALDIELLDHLIITTTSAYSMRAGGKI